MKNILLAIVILIILSTFSNGFCDDTFELRENCEGGITITNSGDCPGYKVRISTLPPSTDGVMNNIGRIVSMVSGSSEYAYTLGTIQNGASRSFHRSELINSSGLKLGDQFQVGKWKVSASYCGEDITVLFKEKTPQAQNSSVVPRSATTSAPRSGATWRDPITGMEFVYVPGGCFQMGSDSADADDDEKPVHRVCVNGFWVGKYEVTQGQWQKVMGSNPSDFQKGSNYPVENVSWEDCQKFIEKLNLQSRKSFYLPTEAEWEYAARGGSASEKYAGSNNVDRVAWHGDNSGSSTHAVGGKSANNFGLYDMSGNVWEWCADWYGEDYYKKSPVQNPQGSGSGSYRVDRGGSWNGLLGWVRSASRGRDGPGIRDFYLGFRLVASGRQ